MAEPEKFEIGNLMLDILIGSIEASDVVKREDALALVGCVRHFRDESHRLQSEVGVLRTALAALVDAAKPWAQVMSKKELSAVVAAREVLDPRRENEHHES